MVRLIRDELLKIATQKKSYIMLFGFAGFMLLGLFAYLSPGGQWELARATNDFQSAEQAAVYFDGMLFSRLLLSSSMMILLPIVGCVLTGDCVAGEMQDGSLKLLLARSRSRSQVILAKFIAVYLVTLLYLAFFAVLPLAVGWIWLGAQPEQAVQLVSEIHSIRWMILPLGEALGRYWLVVGYFAVAILALEAIGIFCSTLFNRMAAATVTLLTVYFVSYLVAALPFTERIRPWLLSFTFNDAFVLFLHPIPWGRIAVNLITLGWYAAFFLLLAMMHFKTKDVK